MAKKINWESMLSLALKNNLARINRNRFLATSLAPFCTPEDLNKIAFLRPESLVEVQVLDHLGKEIVEKHLNQAALISGGAGLLGASAMWLSVPGDTLQFVTQLVIMTQKLAYLYGWDDFFFNEEPTDETIARLSLILGYGVGVHEAKGVIMSVANDMMPNLNEAMAQEQIDKNHPIVKKTVSALSEQLLRTAVSGGLAKVLPIVGAVASGIWSYKSFRPIAERIRLLLSEIMYTRLGHQLSQK